MGYRGWLVCLPLALALVAGCVEHRMVITTEPYGAVVYDEKHQPIGASPADRPYTYYGVYEFTIVKDGYETLVVREDVRPPWYDVFPLDFISENLIPYNFRDVRRFHYCLQPLQVYSPEQVLQQGNQLRDRVRTGIPPQPDVMTPPVVVPAQ